MYQKESLPEFIGKKLLWKPKSVHFWRMRNVLLSLGNILKRKWIKILNMKNATLTPLFKKNMLKQILTCF